VLGGFSQGGASALLTALTSKHKLGGVIGLSTWLTLSKPLSEGELRPEGENPNAGLPVLMCHGDADPLVPMELGQLSVKLLEEFGCKPTFKTYP
jgi:predicted esterase